MHATRTDGACLLVWSSRQIKELMDAIFGENGLAVAK